MKLLLLSALIVLALCQARVIEAAPAWNNGYGNWNGWNGWNNWNNWPAAETVIEAPVAWNNQAWNAYNPAWNAQAWNPSWNGAARPLNWGWEGQQWGNNWNNIRYAAPVAAAAANATSSK